MKTFLSTYKNQITLTMFVAVIIGIAVMRVFDAPLRNQACPNGVISFELAQDLDKSVQIMDSWDDHAKLNMSMSLGFDFLFLVLYSSLIALFINNINIHLWYGLSFYQLGKLLIPLIFIAALFDIIENIALIKLLLGDLKQIWSSIAYYFAMMKFIIILACILYIMINWMILLYRKLAIK